MERGTPFTNSPVERSPLPRARRSLPRSACAPAAPRPRRRSRAAGSAAPLLHGLSQRRRACGSAVFRARAARPTSQRSPRRGRKSCASCAGILMPPPGEPRPDAAEVDAFVASLERSLDAAPPAQRGPAARSRGRASAQPHRVRRHAIRDLLGVERRRALEPAAAPTRRASASTTSPRAARVAFIARAIPRRRAPREQPGAWATTKHVVRLAFRVPPRRLARGSRGRTAARHARRPGVHPRTSRKTPNTSSPERRAALRNIVGIPDRLWSSRTPRCSRSTG